MDFVIALVQGFVKIFTTGGAWWWAVFSGAIPTILVLMTAFNALVIAIGVRETGEREVLGLALGAGESEPFWVEFLRSLVARGLKGVQLVSSDSHEALKAALGKSLPGAAWQRCRVHFALALRCVFRLGTWFTDVRRHGLHMSP